MSRGSLIIRLYEYDDGTNGNGRIFYLLLDEHIIFQEFQYNFNLRRGALFSIRIVFFLFLFLFFTRSACHFSTLIYSIVKAFRERNSENTNDSPLFIKNNNNERWFCCHRRCVITMNKLFALKMMKFRCVVMVFHFQFSMDIKHSLHLKFSLINDQINLIYCFVCFHYALLSYENKIKHKSGFFLPLQLYYSFGNSIVFPSPL